MHSVCTPIPLLTPFFSKQYCGAPVVGEILSDQCHQLTAQARDMGLKIRYDFLMEVFG